MPPLWNVPLQRSLFFVGQDDLLSQLASILRSEKKTALTQPYALNGLGGIGKTQLALEYAYHHRQDYHAILWGRAETREALISTFVRIAALLDLPQKNEKNQMEVVEAVKTWLTGRSGWLFILDNADELALVKEFIPPTFRGDLLITTRAQAMGGFAYKLEVQVMPPETGALLLLRRSGLLATEESLEVADSDDVLVAREISEELGGLPLALDQAGAYIEETQSSLSSYQTLYRTHRAELLRERGGLINNDHPESVATTWSLSFQKVKQHNPAAADLLQFCAYLAPDAIPEAIITRGAEDLGPSLQEIVTDPFMLNKAIAALSAYSLIRRDTRERTLSMHRLVQAVLRDSLSRGEQQQWMQRAIYAVETAYPAPDVSHWPQLEQNLPHALICATWIEQLQLMTVTAAHLLQLTGHYLYERARYREAEPLYERALAICEQALGPVHSNTASSLHNLAILYGAQGRYTEAEPLYTRALVIREQELGVDHPDLANSLESLANLYKTQGRYTDVEFLLQRALAINTQIYGADHLTVARNFNSIALFYEIQGRYVEAQSLLQRALAIDEREFRASPPLNRQ